eukprot:GHVS01076531.1.p1 GENE.GHVS01076531.1~~GHVS01076531.1.p1  ORF type:complete len:177 (+),score=31.53 GHVS01076531.1:1550-2080(+)
MAAKAKTANEQLLELSVGAEAVSKLSADEKQMAPQAVSAEDFQTEQQKFFEDSELYTIVTPPEDMDIIAGWLDMTFSTPYVVKTKVKNCPTCGRCNNFLDVVATALEQKHTPEFLRDVFTGKHGHILNRSKGQRCVCYKCKTQLLDDATKFSSPREPDDATKARPDYVYPVYTYRF